jgi:hypothetical protein
MARELKILVEWEPLLHQILDCTQRFPKSVRHSFVDRIYGLCLDLTQTIVRAQYSPSEEQAIHLALLNQLLAQLRLLLRISADRKYLSLGQLKVFIEGLEGIGYQVHSWLGGR